MWRSQSVCSTYFYSSAAVSWWPRTSAKEAPTAWSSILEYWNVDQECHGRWKAYHDGVLLEWSKSNHVECSNFFSHEEKYSVFIANVRRSSLGSWMTPRRTPGYPRFPCLGSVVPQVNVLSCLKRTATALPQVLDFTHQMFNLHTSSKLLGLNWPPQVWSNSSCEHQIC